MPSSTASAAAGAIDPATAAAYAADVTKVYGQGAVRVTALDHISVGFGSGQLTAVMGPSGSGKSTLLHCVAGLETVDGGTIVRGRDRGQRIGRAGPDPAAARADRVRLSGLQPPADPDRPREHRAALALARRRPDAAWLQRVIAAVGLGDRLSHRPAELSGGQQQRVAVARALASQPALVFADEPTGNLDSRAGAEVLGFLRRSVDELGQTIVMVTHDPFAASHADRVVFLADGRIVDALLTPSAEQVLDRMKSLGG